MQVWVGAEAQRCPWFADDPSTHPTAHTHPQTSSSSMEGSQERCHTWSRRRRRRAGALTATLAVMLLAAPRNAHGFIRTLRPLQATQLVVASLGAPHIQPPERTLPLPDPPGEWEGLPPERHADFLREVRFSCDVCMRLSEMILSPPQFEPKTNGEREGSRSDQSV